MAWVTPALELQNHVLFAELINICIRIMGVWCLPPRKVDAQILPECFGIGMVEKEVWGIQNRNGAVQNVVSDSFLIYSALKTQRLEKPMEQPDCRADKKCFSKVLTRISKFRLVWKFYWNKWKTVNFRNPTHGTGRVAVGAMQTPGILLRDLTFLFLGSKEWLKTQTE